MLQDTLRKKTVGVLQSGQPGRAKCYDAAMSTAIETASQSLTASLS